MDDFERDHPGFDWKNIPAYKHPGGKDCPCPKHMFAMQILQYRCMILVQIAPTLLGKFLWVIQIRMDPTRWVEYLFGTAQAGRFFQSPD